jgi:hypothetical protein
MSRMRFSEGGWVLVVALLLMLFLAVWALTPAFMRAAERPPGDGHDPATYGFNLTALRLPEHAPLQAALIHRDMVPARDNVPSLMDAAAASEEKPRKGPFLTTKDLVIGVEIDGEARAYPLLLMNVHEAMGDTLADTPLLVTWHWPSGATAVYDARINGERRSFGISGLVAGGGQLLYLRNTDGSTGDEPLIAQFTGSSISGDAFTLQPLPHIVTTWKNWRELHPKTTVVAGDPAMSRRYKDGKPDTYFHSSGLLFDVPVPDGGPEAKSPAVVLEHNGHSQLVTKADLLQSAGVLELSVDGEGPVTVRLTDGGRRLTVDAPPGVTVRRGLWHLVHAFGPWESALKH